MFLSRDYAVLLHEARTNDRGDLDDRTGIEIHSAHGSVSLRVGSFDPRREHARVFTSDPVSPVRVVAA